MSTLSYSRDEKDASRERQRINTGVLYIPRASIDESWSAVSGRLGFEYRWNPEVMTYVSAARGYKSGGINAAGTTTFEFTIFDPEFLWTYELGLRSDWLDQRLRFNVSAFYSDYKDLQFRSVRWDPSGTPINPVANVAAAEITGLEVELIAVPAPGWEVSAGFGYMDAKYSEIEPGTPGVTKAMKFPNTPEWSLTLSGQYTRPLPGGAEFTGRVDYAYTAEQQLIVINTPYLVQDAHPMLNARLAYRSSGGRWEVAVFGTNLTSEKLLLAGRDARSMGFIDSLYGPPRQWGASLKFNF